MTFFDTNDWDGRIFDGGWVRTSAQAEARSPSTGASLGAYGVASAEDVDRAVRIARSAQREWAARPADERAAIIRRAGDIISAQADTVAKWLIDEAGSGQGKAAFEAGLVSSEFYQASATAMMPYGSLLQSSRPRLSLARRLPAGVVGVISPFNFPAILAARSVAPALALGNAVVLKPDPRTAISGGLIVAAALADAGVPEGVFHVVPGGVDAGSALVDHPDVRIISFTGSTEAGRAIGARASQLLKRAHLELGGNNALVVMADVDVQAAASAGAWGSFLHQGQICMTTGRHLVHADVYDDYVDALAAKARALPVGDPSTGAPLGPVIDAKQRDRIHAIVTETISAGARLDAGGGFNRLFYQATVLSDVQPEHAAFHKEVFGPVAPVVRYTSEDELVSLVNASEYGLSLGILTREPLRALELADRLPSGILHINDQTVDDEAQAPFGGIGASGTGARFGGHEANIEAFTEQQWVTMQAEIARYPF
ncbi:aldehyde dehydrogenase family protein [Microbacterium sp. BWT-B31]|uniref:aldehyde dehydrogenase family protein n=1 Tax=Microbacterium sp. BWT-B31 TaxID=3232072 RepID=UPI0035280CED